MKSTRSSSNSVVTFNCSEEEIKRHERGVGQRIKRKVKGAVKLIKLEQPNPKYDVHSDRLHCEATFNFFWTGDAERLGHLVEVAEANGDKKFGSSLATLAAALILAFPSHVKKYPRPQGKNLKASLGTILGIREEHKTELDFKKFLDLDEGEEYEASNFNAAPLRNFRGTRTFTDFIFGVELDESIKIEKTSPELRRLRDATNEKIGDIAFANLYENHRRGITTEIGTTASGDTETTKDPETDSSLLPDSGPRGKPVARKRRKVEDEGQGST